jgi:hypothetical protein
MPLRSATPYENDVAHPLEGLCQLKILQRGNSAEVFLQRLSSQCAGPLLQS